MFTITKKTSPLELQAIALALIVKGRKQYIGAIVEKTEKTIRDMLPPERRAN
jgi:hypothetical protein